MDIKLIMKKIMWVSGRCGYGKTTFADSIIKKFEGKNQKICKLEGKDFVSFLVENIRNKNPIENFVSRFQNYDLLVLDDVDYVLTDKPFTQREIKRAIQKINCNDKTKVILITQKRARKLRKLKFDSDECFYKRLKTPTVEIKRNLVEKWLKTKRLTISEEKISEIINKSNNLFQLKGLFNQISFPAKGGTHHF